MLKFGKKLRDDDDLDFRSKRIKDELSDIYNNGNNGEEIDMVKMEKNPKGRLKMFLTTSFSCLFLVFIFFIVGWVVFNRPEVKKENTETKSIILSVIAPEEASSGEKITYKIGYENQDKVKMTKLQLLLSYPEGFIYESSSVQPENSYKNIFSLPDINPFQKGEVEIIGRLVGTEGVKKPILVSLSYEPENFSSEFQELVTAETKIAEAAIIIDITGAQQLISDKEQTYKVEVGNDTEEKIENLRLVVAYPEDFSVENLKPESENDVEVVGLNFGIIYNVWNISALNSKEKKEFTIKGKFSSEAKDDQMFLARVEIGGEGGSYNLIAEDSLDVKAVQKEVDLNLILNGASQAGSVSLGDNLGYSIIYENKGENDLKNISVKAVIRGVQGEKEIFLVDWPTLRDENNGTVKGNEILWTSEEILKLSSFSSKEEGTIDFFVDLKEAAQILKEIDSAEGDLELESWVEMSVGKVEETEVNMVIKSNVIRSQINTNVVLDSQARYFNDDNIAVGSGPLPPKVGEDTKYRIFWTVENSLHEIQNIEVIASLPNNVSWSGKINADRGDVSFDESSREITWKMSSLPQTIKKASLDFEIGIKPSEEDLNKILILLGQTSLTGIDAATKTDIYVTHPPLSTDLTDDPITSGRGLVE